MHRTHLPETSARKPYPQFKECLPHLQLSQGRYLVRFAQTAEDLDAVLKLRFEVFNLELLEGFESSYRTQRDEDEYDQQCHHLMVIDQPTGQVIGTYRMQTTELARRGTGLYSRVEFDLSVLPAPLLDEAVELGRACVAKEHRNMRVLLLLWHGLAAYVAHNRKRYLFGCCSLTSQDPAEGKRVMDHLEANGFVHPTLRVLPQPGFQCYLEGHAPSWPPATTDAIPQSRDVPPTDVKIPRLMKIYLAYGAKICGPPAIDRQFKTIDYLGLIDVQELDKQTYRYFFR
jgi:putative hemolysin